MKVEITKDGKKVEVEIENPKGKHRKMYFKAITSVGENTSDALKLLETRDKILSELTGMSLKDLDELDVVEKDRMFNEVENAFMSSLGKRDFLSTSSKPPERSK